jgi:Pyridoxal-dependent decarboxylase conserved domain
MALHAKAAGGGLDGQFLSVIPLDDGEIASVPKHRMPDGPMAPDVAYQIVHDELMLDGNARLNLATFVTTHMEPEAEKLMAEYFDKNMIDKDEYPQIAELEMRCVSGRSWPSARFREALASCLRPNLRSRAARRTARGLARPTRAPLRRDHESRA